MKFSSASKRPSQNSYTTQSDECSSTLPSSPTKKGTMNFDFGSNIDETKFSIGSKSLSRQS